MPKEQEVREILKRLRKEGWTERSVTKISASHVHKLFDLRK